MRADNAPQACRGLDDLPLKFLPPEATLEQLESIANGDLLLAILQRPDLNWASK